MCQTVVVEVVAGLEQFDLSISEIEILARLAEQRARKARKVADKEGFVPEPGRQHMGYRSAERFEALAGKMRAAAQHLVAAREGL